MDELEKRTGCGESQDRREGHLVLFGDAKNWQSSNNYWSDYSVSAARPVSMRQAKNFFKIRFFSKKSAQTLEKIHRTQYLLLHFAKE